jgi:hypothetical protein
MHGGDIFRGVVIELIAFDGLDARGDELARGIGEVGKAFHVVRSVQARR